jgi:hypothetical protein
LRYAVNATPRGDNLLFLACSSQANSQKIGVGVVASKYTQWVDGSKTVGRIRI